MSRIVDAPISVTLGPDGNPVAFVYRQESHRVAGILDTWTMFGTLWWEDPKAVGQPPEEEHWWRVQTTRGGVFELIRGKAGWRLWKSYD